MNTSLKVLHAFICKIKLTLCFSKEKCHSTTGAIESFVEPTYIHRSYRKNIYLLGESVRLKERLKRKSTKNIL